MSAKRAVGTATSTEVVTADGVRLSVLHLTAGGQGPAFVIGHGFTNFTGKATTRLIIGRFGRYGAVYAPDFRGHGGSGGQSSVGRDEHLDLDATIAAARTAGYGPVHLVGFSMGGSAALRQAAIGDHPPDGVASVSAPSRWFIRESVPMRRVHWLLEHPLGRTVGRALGVRLSAPWAEVPTTPLELMDRIAPVPLLLVHGTADHYFGPAHAVALQAASHGHAELWIEPGMGHAESGSRPELIDRIAEWFRGHAAHGSTKPNSGN